MKKALIISLSPHIGHLSHVVAYYRLFEELGFESTIYVLPGSLSFLPEGLHVTTKINSMKEYHVALMYSPCFRNITEAMRIKFRSKCKLIYVYHEPLSSKKSFREAGVSWLKTQIIFMKDKANYLLVKLADHIILSSKTALLHYKEGIYQRLNHNYTGISLIFTDENDSVSSKTQKEYFSYIGTIAADHSYKEYLAFVKWAVNNQRLDKVIFQIATKSSVEHDSELNRIIETGRLKVLEGRPLTNDEINRSYASSFVVWNAYERTTQSGVLAKAFMFGTPAIVLKKNLSEFTEDGKEVIAIDSNTSFEQIANALVSINQNKELFSQRARKRFEEVFFYRRYCDTFNSILSEL